MDKKYPKYYDHLSERMSELRERLPGTTAAFGQLHHKAVEDGALSSKVKELIALGIAIATHCDGCISYHVHDALKAGASRQQISEAIGVAVLMGGQSSLMYGCKALEAVEEFESTGLG